jgi:hypothetical protein
MQLCFLEIQDNGFGYLDAKTHNKRVSSMTIPDQGEDARVAQIVAAIGVAPEGIESGTAHDESIVIPLPIPAGGTERQTSTPTHISWPA